MTTEFRVGLLVGGIALALGLAAPSALADKDRSRSDGWDDDHHGHRPRGGVCTQTAALAASACRSGVADDYATASARCLHESDAEERDDCFDEARSALADGRGDCRDQLAARKRACGLLGEERYDPAFEPADFVTEFANPSASNPYLPLGIGYRWEYESEDEETVVEVLDRTKSVEGVTCVVVRDVVSEDGRVVEDTDDWIAQALDGDVYYCGEEVKDFESFSEDSPALPELVSIDGSFKAGREGAKPGILFLAQPRAGAAYRQEFALGEAEDVAQVLAVDYGYGRHPALDAGVPEELAAALCGDHDCVVTREFSPLDPGVVERKYHARGIGLFLEVKPDTGEVNRLVGCSFDARCDALEEP